MTRTEKTWAALIFAALPVAILAASLFIPPITQNADYHNFADQRTLFGVPNFYNVVSNAAFLLTAAFGFAKLPSRSAHVQAWQRIAFGVLIAGTIMVAFGSAYYHLNPNSATLFWDRLPMTLVFTSIFALIAGDCIHSEVGRRSLVPLLAIGVASIVYWRARATFGLME